MVIYEALSWGSKVLAFSPSPRLDARILLSHCLKMDTAALLLHRDSSLSPKEEEEYKELILRRSKSEPISYIVGEKEFMSLPFSVSPSVLIPRPETELLIEWITEHFSPTSILDIGTGSGCIAISLASFFKNASVTAVDISSGALAIAKDNAERNDVSVSFLEMDILKEVPCGTYDCIVSNPPYIKTDVLPSLDRDVRDYEPKSALDGGEDGLIFYRRIISIVPFLLNKGGLLAFEIGYDQGKSVPSLMEDTFCEITVHKDLAGNDRMVTGIKK